ncbi:AAA family ATPase [Leeia aquatica]|uniref:AAA family ATPase n=1 Tax=Leeia aquatica TaxID=2725557 RepID=A0A847SG88_9NEIS|nr:AAA family ATPase [Leeia aquatica]NLR76258.1 AAA family ATPase [Leeia aquatica]
MFRILQLDMIHWDFWQGVSVPLDAQIVTIIGPNGSGKTTLLDALRTMLALDCSGRRDYKRYVRNNKTPFAWLRGRVANPRTSGLFPYPFWPHQSPEVTLFCRIRKQGGDWVRQYAIADGDVPLNEDSESTLEWLGVQEYRRRLEQAGLTPAIAKVLALEQGDTDKLCEYSPKALLDLVFQVFGDKAVLDHYAEAKAQQQQVEHELEELDRASKALEHEAATASQRADKYLEWKRLSDDLLTLDSEVLPRMRLEAQYQDLSQRWKDYRLPWHTLREQGRQAHELEQQHIELTQRLKQAQSAVEQAERIERDALRHLTELQSHAQQHEELLKLRDRLTQLAKSHPGADQLADQVADLRNQLRQCNKEREQLLSRRDELNATLTSLQQTGQMPLPREVSEFRRLLDSEGIAHDLLVDIVDIADPHWQAAIEGILRGNRYLVLLKRSSDRRRARELAQRARYRHFIVDEREPVGTAKRGSLLEAIRFNADAPGWLVEQLNRISRVDSVADGETVQGDWITPDGYFKERRGSRHIGVEAHDYCLGTGVKKQREQAVHRELADLHEQDMALQRRISALNRELSPLQQMLDGVDAAHQLALRADDFATAEEALASMAQLRQDAGQALATAQDITRLERDACNALDKQRDGVRRQQYSLEASLEEARRLLTQRRLQLRDLLAQLRQVRHGMPAAWLLADARRALCEQYQSLEQVRAQIKVERDRLDAGLARGEWITDETVLLRRDKLQQLLQERQQQLDAIGISLARARTLTEDARGAYINKLKSTVRAYGRNVKQLGALAGIEVESELPHLDNDDLVLAQAGLVVKFNFDQKGMMGLNDGEASGGQQVMKSLILLIGLMMNDSQPSGFVFIDEPFAHLDIFNIDRVGAFLKATEAQYLITSPNTHNVNIFEPSELTLTTRKKRPGESWAPPLLQTRRKRAALAR